MSQYAIIKGGKKLKGTVKPVPNKNSILPALCACLLTDKEITYKGVPRSTDVLKMLEMLKLLGADVNDSDFNKLKISCKRIRSCRVDKDLGCLIRSSIMFAGPLLARFGVAEIPVPGGCVLGKRSIAAHIDSFTKVGIKTEFINGGKDRNNDDTGYIRFTTPEKLQKRYKIWQFEASVTATENLLMYAAGTDSKFEITEAASEPHIIELTKMLMNMGAHINGIGSNKIEVKGTKKIRNCTFEPQPDFVDIGGLTVAAAVTKGKIRIKGANIPEIVDGIIGCFEKFNLKIDRAGKDLVVDGNVDLFIDPKTTGFPLAADDLPKMAPRPWPGFPVDLLPVLVTLACKTKGKLLVHNWMYETGLEFVKDLNQIGANISILDSQKVIVNGPVTFKGGQITPEAIIQACKSVFLAALADDVETTITGVDILKRRYPDIIENYKKLGANIKGPFEIGQ